MSSEGKSMVNPVSPCRITSISSAIKAKNC